MRGAINSAITIVEKKINEAKLAAKSPQVDNIFSDFVKNVKGVKSQDAIGFIDANESATYSNRVKQSQKAQAELRKLRDQLSKIKTVKQKFYSKFK